MNLQQRMNALRKMEHVETPWHVMRVFGKLSLCGSLISATSDGPNDYVTSKEFKKALEWLVLEFNGQINWSKDE